MSFLYSGLSSKPMPFLLVIRHASKVVPEPQKGSNIVSPTKEYNFIMRNGKSIGKGAGCNRFDSAWKNHAVLVHSLNSSAVISDILEPDYFFHELFLATIILSTCPLM